MATVVVVAASGQGPALVRSLSAAGYEVSLAGSFPEAIALLERARPDLLVAEIRLGAYNGLHLVLRHRETHPDMRSLLLAPTHDPVLAKEAAALGALYATPPADEREFLLLVGEALGVQQPLRRWPRKRPTVPIEVRIADRTARVLDLSYGGVRFETHESGTLPPLVEISIPGSGISVAAEPIWAHPGPSGVWWYGAVIAMPNQVAQQEWRQLVDSVPSNAA